MRRKIQMVVDGVPLERVVGRVTGSFDVEGDEALGSGFTDVGVAVVVYKVAEATAIEKPNGDLVRKHVYRVSDFQVADEDLREFLVHKLNLYGVDDDLFSVPAPVQQKDPEPEPEPEPESEEEPEVEPQDEFEVGDADSGHPIDPEPEQPVEERSEPKSRTGNPDRRQVSSYRVEDDAVLPRGEVVGSVYGGRGRDSALEDFLNA